MYDSLKISVIYSVKAKPRYFICLSVKSSVFWLNEHIIYNDNQTFDVDMRACRGVQKSLEGRGNNNNKKIACETLRCGTLLFVGWRDGCKRILWNHAISSCRRTLLYNQSCPSYPRLLYPITNDGHTCSMAPHNHAFAIVYSNHSCFKPERVGCGSNWALNNKIIRSGQTEMIVMQTS